MKKCAKNFGKIIHDRNINLRNNFLRFRGLPDFYKSLSYCYYFFLQNYL